MKHTERPSVLEQSESQDETTDYLADDTDEKKTGYPNPKLYDQFFINSYSLPKGLQSNFRDRSQRPPK